MAVAFDTNPLCQVWGDSELSFGVHLMSLSRRVAVSLDVLTQDSIAAARKSGLQEVDKLWRCNTSLLFCKWHMRCRYRGSKGDAWLIWQFGGKALIHEVKWLSNKFKVKGEMTTAFSDCNNGPMSRTRWIVHKRIFGDCCGPISAMYWSSAESGNPMSQSSSLMSNTRPSSTDNRLL